MQRTLEHGLFFIVFKSISIIFIFSPLSVDGNVFIYIYFINVRIINNSVENVLNYSSDDVCTIFINTNGIRMDFGGSDSSKSDGNFSEFDIKQKKNS